MKLRRATCGLCKPTKRYKRRDRKREALLKRDVLEDLVATALKLRDLLRYEVLPGDVDFNGQVTGADLTLLLQALASGTANLPDSVARYDMDRSGTVNTVDLLCLTHLLNGINTPEAWNGVSVVGCRE